MAHFIWNFCEPKQSFKINKKARIRVIVENMGKLLTEHMRKELRNQILFNPCCLELNRLVWQQSQRQDGLKDNAVWNSNCIFSKF